MAPKARHRSRGGDRILRSASRRRPAMCRSCCRTRRRPRAAGSPVDVVLAVVRAVPQIAYVKEEAMPSGARITRTLGERTGHAARRVRRRRRAATSPTSSRAAPSARCRPCELAEVHVALLARASRAAIARACARSSTGCCRCSTSRRCSAWRSRRRCCAAAASSSTRRKRAAGPDLDAGDHARTRPSCSPRSPTCCTPPRASAP